MWCIGELSGEYIKRMEDILNLYECPYRRKEPVICFDEKMHHLVSDVRSTASHEERIYKEEGLRV